MQALLNYKNKYLQKTARMIDLLKLINYDIKVTQRRITLAACFHSKQVFPAPKQTKGVDIEDAQSTKLFHYDHGNEHDPIATTDRRKQSKNVMNIDQIIHRDNITNTATRPLE